MLNLLKIKKNNRGFTLLEATIAVMILMIGLLAIVQLFPFALKIISNSQSLTIASNLAVAKIEEIQSSIYDNINTGTIEPKHRLSSDPTNYLYHYERETTAETVDSDFNSSLNDLGLKKITVTVFWRSPVIGLTEKSIKINSVVANH